MTHFSLLNMKKNVLSKTKATDNNKLKQLISITNTLFMYIE